MKKQLLTKHSLLKIMKFSILQSVIALIFTSLSFALDSKGQQLLDQAVTINCKEQKLESVLAMIEENTKVKYVFSSKFIQSAQKVSLNVKNEKLASVLGSLLNSININTNYSVPQMLDMLVFRDIILWFYFLGYFLHPYLQFAVFSKCRKKKQNINRILNYG